jgi:hypothetical protein
MLSMGVSPGTNGERIKVTIHFSSSEASSAMAPMPVVREMLLKVCAARMNS